MSWNWLKWSAVGVAVMIAVPGAWAQRVAVWNPEAGTKQSRFRVSLELHDRAATLLKTAGLTVDRVTADQLADAAAFNGAKYEAFVFAGDAVPRAALENLKKFLDDKSVLVALHAEVPFLVAIAKDKDGSWTMSPDTPTFAWQTEELLTYAGGKYFYNPAFHGIGRKHTVTPLFKSYLPAAPELAMQVLDTRFVVPWQGGEYYPLIRSLRLDGRDAMPQLWVMRNRGRTSVVCGSPIWTGNAKPEIWALSDQTVVAMTRLACDLRRGKATLDPADKIALSEKMPPPEPLTTRLARTSVDPENVKPLARWGKFDGSCLELGLALAVGKAAVLEAGAADNAVPRGLEAGAAVTFKMPAKPIQVALVARIRGAFAATGGVMTVRVNGEPVWSERFTYTDAGGAGNIEAAELKDTAAEFTRLIFLPVKADGPVELTIANGGDKPFYFDAVQIEKGWDLAPEMNIGFNGAPASNPELARHWGAARVTIKPHLFIGAPGTPDRWKKYDEAMDKLVALGCPLQFILEGSAEWLAVTPERFRDESKRKGGRPWCVAADGTKYLEVLDHLLDKYGDRIAAFELWNEANGTQFWKGSYEEYAAFCKVLIPRIRQKAPHAKIMSTGTAGWNDRFFAVLRDSGVLDLVDWVPNHVYAGKGTAWDIAFGVGEGAMFADGCNKPVHCNEQGFVWANEQWFTAPPVYTPYLQMTFTNKAMARLLANPVAMVSVFHAQSTWRDKFSYDDENGRPRPAYAVVADYLELNGGRRLPFAMTAPGGEPLQGVYGVAVIRKDGAVTAVLNPAEVDRLEVPQPPPVQLRDELDQMVDWGPFNGKPLVKNGICTMVPAKGQAYMGMSKPVSLDLNQWPIVEISAPRATGVWQFTLTLNGQTVTVFADAKAGVFRKDLRALVAGAGVLDGQMTFRSAGETDLDYVRFLADDGKGGGDANGRELVRDFAGTSFFGKMEKTAVGMQLTPDAGKMYMGFTASALLDPAAFPLLTVETEGTGAFEVTFKAGGESGALVAHRKAGKVEIDLRSVLKTRNRVNAELTFRAKDAPLLVKSFRFARDPNAAPTATTTAPAAAKAAPAKAAPQPVTVRLPLTADAIPAAATARTYGQIVKVPFEVKRQGPVAWAELTLDLTGRTVLTLNQGGK